MAQPLRGASRITGFRVLANIRSSVWFLPVLCVIAGVLLSFGTIAVDRLADFSLVPRSLTGGPDAGMAILETIATAEVTLVALVLTVTMVVVQLAMGQFSPRIVATFLRDKPSQLAIGLFVATFAHTILAMREVDFDQKQVPGVAVVVAYVLVVMSIGLLVVYVDHIGKSLRVSSLIELVGSATRATMDRRYPDRGAAPSVADTAAGGRTIRAPHSGVLTRVDEGRLVAAARHGRCVLDVRPSLGAFVPAGAVLCGVRDGGEGLHEDDVLSALQLGQDRSLDQDVAYGLRMLVDIAERSLADSPFLDPTTAVQAIDRLHDCLRQLVNRPFPPGELTDDDGVVRVVLSVMTWDAYVHLAFDEIRLAGAGSPQVARRLEEALRDLRAIAPLPRRPVLDDELSRLEDSIRERYVDVRDQDLARGPDRQGSGTALASRDGRGA